MPNHGLPATSEFFKGKLYQQMQDDLHLAGMAQRTIHGYLRSVRQLADFCQCSPGKVSEEQLRQWLLHLKIEKQFAYGSLRVAYSGVKFFFTRTCRRQWKTLAAMASRTVANANAKWPVETQNGNRVNSSDRFPVTTVHPGRDRLRPKPNCLRR